MKRKNWKYTIIYVLVVAIVSLILWPTSTQAQSKELPQGMVIGDDQGIFVKKNGKYLVEVNDVMPGKKWHTTISMINMEKDTPYSLTMLISKPSLIAGSLDLSTAIQMKITYENEIVYEGPVSGINLTQNLQNTALELGTFKAGDSRAMEVDFSLSGEYTKKDFSEKNVMENVWNFYAVKTKSTDSNEIENNKPLGKLPQTGEEWRQTILYVCLGLFLLLIVLLFGKEKRKKK
ncbi:hypothetical protein [Enterococcus sp. LJL51]|uniref:hypothetical protein n=1 Tax=Enterococcus sp. LJL51 TaxID=3416656 RepID=UPI003CED904C